MPLTIDRNGACTRPREGRRRRHGGPVILATFDHARFDASAARVAVEAAADMRSTVYVVDVVRTERRAAGDVPAEQAAALRAVDALAADLGVDVERLQVVGPRRDAALLAVAEERRPALVVLATDQTVLRRFRRPRRRWHRRLIEVLAEHTSCLLWIAQEPLPGAAASAARSVSRARPAPARGARPGAPAGFADPTSGQIATTDGTRS
jgi:nucleotide-binding universal stress UspA family protein